MLIAEGLRLMVIGMFVVFCFLSLLVLTMNLSARFFKTFADYFPDTPAPKTNQSASPDSDTEIAVVLAAVKHYTQS